MYIKLYLYRILLILSCFGFTYLMTMAFLSHGIFSDNTGLIGGGSIIFWLWMLIFSIYDLVFRYKQSIVKWLLITLIPFIGVYLYFERVLRNKLLSDYKINKLNPKQGITEKEIISTMLRRAGAAFVDYVVVTQFIFWNVMLYGQTNEQGQKSLSDGDAIYIILFWLFYLPLAEYIFGRTLGKWIFGIKVVRGDGTKLDFSGAFKRRFVDIIDLLVFFFLFIRVRKTIKLPRRLGDYLGNSWVVRTNPEKLTA